LEGAHRHRQPRLNPYPGAHRLAYHGRKQGFKVVELSTHIAAPGAGGILADWGADVIKVEGAEGDPIRRGFEHLTPDGENPGFQLDNRGKRSVVLDIRKPDGREALVRLIREADIFITNRRPSALKAARIDYETMKLENPRLIYASVTGYGLEGPEADLPGFDVAAFWSRAGVASLTIPKGEDPFALRTGVGDHTCTLATTSAILAAALERSRTGVGRLVETSLIRSGVYSVGADMAIYLRLGRIASNRPRKETIAPLVNFFKSAEGRWICLMPRDNRTDWPKIAAAAEREDLIDHPEFATDSLRRKNVGPLVETLDEAFGKLPFDLITQRLTAADVVWAGVQTPAEVAADPQAAAAGCFVEMPDRGGGTFRAPAAPVRFPGADLPVRGPAPLVGEHTDEVLAEIGYSADQIAAMKAAGATA
jgi:crotonobetainyl-CoA:carnitine CoA-transferase CaiB-like acyl-CoA transferase